MKNLLFILLCLIGWSCATTVTANTNDTKATVNDTKSDEYYDIPEGYKKVPKLKIIYKYDKFEQITRYFSDIFFEEGKGIFLIIQKNKEDKFYTILFFASYTGSRLVHFDEINSFLWE